MAGRDIRTFFKRLERKGTSLELKCMETGRQQLSQNKKTTKQSILNTLFPLDVLRSSCRANTLLSDHQLSLTESLSHARSRMSWRSSMLWPLSWGGGGELECEREKNQESFLGARGRFCYQYAYLVSLETLQ